MVVVKRGSDAFHPIDTSAIFFLNGIGPVPASATTKWMGDGCHRGLYPNRVVERRRVWALLLDAPLYPPSGSRV